MTTLRLVTLPAIAGEDCHGTYTCPCQPCVRDRTSRAPLGAGPAQFQVQPPRQRAA